MVNENISEKPLSESFDEATILAELESHHHRMDEILDAMEGHLIRGAAPDSPRILELQRELLQVESRGNYWRNKLNLWIRTQARNFGGDPAFAL